MRLWLVCRDGRPRAVFSTAGGAGDYVADNGGAICCDVQCLVLDAWTRTQRWHFQSITKWLAGEQR
jgi:hypothetical protein